MTEEEAKTKCCCGPEGCGRTVQVGQANDWHPEHLCLGSACMAWRWREPPGPQPPDAPERDNRGYCGLAGRP